ncbi:MAG: hypothetical protein WD738_11375 [Pirellulales bacterium]
MAPEEDDDLYDEEFDFVDEEEAETDVEEPVAAGEESPLDEGAGDEEEAVDEYGRPQPQANYVVHIYEGRKFKRTIDRPFTPEDAEAFATEYNRTSKSYHRFAVTGKNDSQPKKSLD